MTAFADSALDYVDIGTDGPWGSFRLIVGGKDVTYFRGIPATIGGYQLTEPYSYGPANFGLPSLTSFEVDAWGAGDLSWMGNGKPVRLIHVDSSGVKVRTVWRGFVTMPEVTNDGVLLHCDGEVSGKLALRDKHPDLFSIKQHVGRKIFDSFAAIHTPLTPYLGGDQGVQTDGRGMSGSMLDHVDALLAATITQDGSQLTIWRRDTQGDYHLGDKDVDTVDFSVFNGVHGVELDLQDDLSEAPNAIYGQGVAPNGLVWVNGKYPNLIQGDAPDFPNGGGAAIVEGDTDADTGSGDGVTVMIAKLVGAGYLDRRDKPGGFDSDVTDAIVDLQDDAGITQSGHMTTATWDALWDLTTTGTSLKSAHVAPLAQTSATRKYLRTSNGSVAGKNPDFDPSIPQVDLSVDHGVSVEKSRARKYSRGVLHRAQSGKNWAGTITLSADVFAGNYNHTDGSPTLMSRLDIKAGMNVIVKHFDTNTQLHVAIVNVASDLSVTLGVDTKARDAATLGEVIARRIESRSHPTRAWKRARRTDANTRLVEYSSEVGGLVFNTINCAGDDWTVFQVVAGQAGSAGRIRIQTSDDAAKFCVAVFGQKVGPGWLRQKVGNPFDVNADGESKWTNAGVQSYLDNQRVLLGAWGDDLQPCGYYPRSHTKADGTTSDAPITGLFLDDGGFDYHTFGNPVLYFAVYADRDTKIKPQRVMWETLEVLT